MSLQNYTRDKISWHASVYCMEQNNVIVIWMFRLMNLLKIIYNITGSPPAPSRPTIVAVKSNAVTIQWTQSVCDGGHTPQSYTIRYKRSSSYSSYTYIRQITQKRFKITGLSYSMSYQFSISTTTVDSRISSYSSLATISTLPQGKLELQICSKA